MKIVTHTRIFTCLLFFGTVINMSFSQMIMNQFRTYIEEQCYDWLDNEELIYGQKYPLAHTLENFLNLVEMYELANPDKSLKDVTALLLRNYTYENLVRDDDFHDWRVSGTAMDNIQKYWKTKLPTEQMNENNPFDADEICSLFFMLSHTVNDTAWPFEKSYSKPHTGSNGQPTGQSVVKTENPREQGIIAIKMGNRAVAIGRVIAGIYLAAAAPSTDKLYDLVRDDIKQNLPEPQKSAVVNPLYLLTINDLLALLSWNPGSMKQIGGNGKWDSVQNVRIGTHFNTTGICPNVYRLPEKESSLYTYSSLRGAIDGIILGNMLLEETDLKDKKLSQILRMYYSESGLSSSKTKEKHVSFCSRNELIREYSDEIKNEITNSIYVLSDAVAPKKIDQRVTDTTKNYEDFVENGNIMDANDNSDITTVCNTPSSTQTNLKNFAGDPKNETHEGTNGKFSCDTPADVIAILDTQNGDQFLQNQQIILGYLANKLRLWHQGSKLTVLLDQRNDTSGLNLKCFLSNSSCSSCAACNLVHQHIETNSGQGATDKDIIIQSVDKFLKDRKEEEKELNGAAGKVLVYFNFDGTETKSSRLDKVLSDLFLRHLDTTIFALGKDKEILKRFSRGVEDNSILATEPNLKSVADDLADRICVRPAALKYDDCFEAKNERSAVYEGLITPNTMQYWAMDPKYFFKSYTSKIFVELEDSNGIIDIYHTRTEISEINEKIEKNRKQLNHSVTKLTYEHINPCKGFTSVTCGPMSFVLLGRERKDEDGEMQMQAPNTLCQDKEGSNCKRLDQIRFKIHHEGIRCNSCSGLSSTILVILVSVISAFLVSS